MNDTEKNYLNSQYNAAFIAVSILFVLLAFLHLYMTNVLSRDASEKLKRLVSFCFCSCAVETGHGLVVAVKFAFNIDRGWCKVVEPIGMSSAAVARSCAYWMMKYRIRYLNDCNENFRLFLVH